MDRPLAVTVEKPRFSWEWDAEENNVYQSAYQIIVQKEDGVLVWDSTRTAGRDTTDIEYFRLLVSARSVQTFRRICPCS